MSIDWKTDYEQLLYYAREQMKQDAYKHLHDNTVSFDDKVLYATQIIESHFMRSVQAFINNYGKRKTHPKFNDYAAMMLNQDTYLQNLPKGIREELVWRYGKKKGIEKGTYYYPKTK